jgi:hypothetical protein
LPLVGFVADVVQALVQAEGGPGELDELDEHIAFTLAQRAAVEMGS